MLSESAAFALPVAPGALRINFAARGRLAHTPRPKYYCSKPTSRATVLCALEIGSTDPVRSVAPTSSEGPLGNLGSYENEAWVAAADEISQLFQRVSRPIDESQVTDLVARAFGWGRRSQRFWRGQVKEEVPSPEVVKASVKFLKSSPLDLSEGQVADIVLSFPEVLRLDVEARMLQNLNHLIKSWPVFASPDRLRAAVLRQPQILGYTVDCGGDCQSECSQCWAQF